LAEESPSTPGQNDDALKRLERRIENLEVAAQRENRWWRGGLIAALALVALSILIAGHHRHHHPQPEMPMPGWGGPRLMPYGPPPPPYWGYGPGGGYYGPPEGWRYRQWNRPSPEAPPPPPKS
jgi:hypothetical protein